MNEEIKKLYKVLSEKGYYTKSFDDFNKQWEDDSYKKKVYNAVSRDGLYTKDYNSFTSKYSVASEVPVKKKEPTVSQSGQPKAKSSSATSVKKTGKPSVGSGLKSNDTKADGEVASFTYNNNKYYTLKDQPVWHTRQQITLPDGSTNYSYKPVSSDLQEKIKKSKKINDEKSNPANVHKVDVGKRKDLFIGYPGKENKVYRLERKKGGDVWYEIEKENVYHQDTGDIRDEYTKEITDPNRVNALNKYFKQSASTSSTEPVFTGYPGKEENEYRERDGVWQRKQKGSTKWEDIYNDSSIKALNKQFNKNVPLTGGAKGKYIQFVENKAENKVKKYNEELDKSINSISSSLIGKEEVEVVSVLKKKFPEFSFRTSGMFTDNMIVTAPDGENKIEVSLDNWTDAGDADNARALRQFIRTWSNQDLVESKIESSKASEKHEEFISLFRHAKPGDSEYIQGVAESMQPLVVKVLAEKSRPAKPGDAQYQVGQPDYLQPIVRESDFDYGKSLELKKEKADKEYAKQLSYAFSDVYEMQKQSLKSGSNISEDDVIAAYASLPKDKESGQALNRYANDVNILAKNHQDKVNQFNSYTNDISEKIKSGEISKEEYESKYKGEIESMADGLNKDSELLREDMRHLLNSNDALEKAVAQQYIIDEAKGTFVGGIGYKFAKGLTYMPRIIMSMNKEQQERLAKDLSGVGTTEAYMSSEDRSDFAKAMFSLSESIGVMASAAPFGPSAKYARYLGFFSQGYYELKDELDEIEGISEWEKALMASSYGAISGLLEKFGLEYAMGKTAAGNNIKRAIMRQFIKDIPKNATKEVIDATIMNTTRNYLKSVGINIVGAKIVEGATESLQATAKIGVQELYELAHGTNYFNNKSSWEIFSDVVYEGYLGAIGGGVMSGLHQSKNIVERGVRSTLNKDQIDMLMTSAKIEGISESLLANLKASILTGKISHAEAVEISRSFDNIRSKIDSMPENMSNENKSVALDLMIEKEKIESMIKGKDENLTAGARKRISEINNQLQELNKDAVQEQATSEVPVQPEAAVGEEVVKGESKTESEVATEIKDITASKKEIDKLDKEINSTLDYLRKRRSSLETDGLSAEEIENSEEIKSLTNRASELEAKRDKLTEKINKWRDKVSKPEVATEEGKGQVTTREIVNRPATLSEFGGNKFDSPLKGDLYVEGQQVVFEDRESGRIYELGNVDQVMDTQIPGLDVEQENISITSSGQVSIDGTNWNIQTELPTQGIEYNPAGEVTRVSLKDDAGNTKMFDGQQAVDIAYQIELQKYQTEEQQQFINDLLEQDEEFQAATEFIKPTETKAVVEEEAAADTVQAEPTAEVDQEAEQLGQLLEAQNVDQQAESIPDRRVRKQVANAVKALAKIAPKVRFVVHEDERSYREATDEVKREQASNGTYDPKTKTIHINLSKANARTVAHETFHAILLDRVMSDEQAAKVTKRMIDAISARLDNDPALKRYLEDFASNYKENLKNEEKLAELVGKLADQYESQTETFKDIVNRWLNKLAQMFGLQEVTSEQEVMDLLNTIARKVARGKSIKDKDVSKIMGGKIVENPSQGLTNRFRYGNEKVKLEVTYLEQDRIDELIKKELVTQPDNLSQLNGMRVVTTSPDDMLVGTISINGEKKAEGNGGVFFVTKFGDIWANSDKKTANMLKNAINEASIANNGKSYLALAKGSDVKLVSSPQGVTSSLAVAEAMLDAELFSLSDFRTAVRTAVKSAGGEIKLSPTGSAKQLKSEVDNFFQDVNSSTFEKRGNVLKGIIANLAKSESAKKNKNEIIAFLDGDKTKGIGVTVTPKSQSLIDLVAKVSAEKLTKGLNTGDIYAVIEIDGKVDVFQDKHQSYPFHIRMIDENGKASTKKPILILPKNRKNGKEILISVDGQTAEQLGLSFAGKVGATANLPLGKGIIQDREGTSNVTDRKQISDRKQIESKTRRQEPVAGNKLFNDPIPEATEIAISYSKKSGIPYVNVEKITKLDENNSKAIAREFDKMKNDPTNPEVREAYEAMVKETIAQYEEITSKGYSVEINNNEPYSSSQDMISDVRDNKRMRIFSTESGFGDIEITEEQRAENPLLQRTKFKDKNGVPLLANDLFRFVHDFFGHAKMGNSFGPIGEENAWRVHSVMYSDLARRAMTSETRGQNSWVNFSGVNDNAFKLRDKARQLRKEGKKDQADKLTEKVYEQMSFAEQKVGLMPEWVSETNGRKQISDVVNRKQDKTASSIVSIARKNGFSEAAIQKYLRDKGFSAEEISRAMAINENVNIDQIFEQSEKDLLDKRKKAGFVKSLQYVWNKLFDRQSRIKSIISKTGKTERTWYGKKIQTDKKAQRAHDLLVTKAGARGYSNYRFKEADKKIFKGLSDKLRDEFDKMIYAKRIISINENRAERGLEAYTGVKRVSNKLKNDLIEQYKKNNNGKMPEGQDLENIIEASKIGYSEAEARRDLSDMRLRLGDKKFADLEIRAGEYFDVFEESLKHLYESGRINQGLYETLKDIEYSPITTIKYIIADNSSLDEINRQAEEFGVTREDIMSLTDSNENSVIMDSRWLMMMNLMSVESRAFENKMLRAFADSLSDSSADVKAALSEYIMFAKEDGTGAPVGFRRVNYFVDGKKKTLLVRSDVANQLLDVKNRSKGLETLGKLTGTQILRFFATGGNPVFIIGNTALDFSNVLFFTDVYHPIKVIGGVQLSWDFMSKFLGKIAQTGKYKQLMKEYMENGGSLEFLSSDGIRSLRDARRTTKGLNIAQKALLNIGSFMSYAGETSEIAMRMAVFGKVKSDLIAKYQKDLIEQYKKNNNGKMPKGEDLDEIKKMPKGQDLEDILRSAARQGRETVDFAQGGEWSKNADLVAPYLNAGMQGLRKPLQYAVDNPVGFANSVIQGSLMAGSLAFYSISALVSAFGGDDDDKEKAEKIKKALASVPKSDKAQYHIIFTGEKDEKGEYVYLRIKKLPLLSIATTWAEQIAYKHAIESLGGEYETNSMIETLEYSSPIIPNYRIVERNPLLAGVLGYAMNKNLFTGQDIFRQQSDKKIEPWAEGQYDNKVEPIYKWVGKHTGLSPIRTKYLVEKIITSPTTNPTVGVFYSTTSGMPMGEMWDDIKKSITENASKKLFRTTNSNLIKYAEEDKIKDEVMKLYTERYLKEEYVKSEVNKALDEGDGLTESQLEKLVVDNFDEVDQLKYFKKYYLYTKRRDIDQTTLDLFFEDDPKVAGFLLYERFGDEIDDDEYAQIVLASEALGGARIGKKTMYHYNEYIEMYKNKK